MALLLTTNHMGCKLDGQESVKSCSHSFDMILNSRNQIKKAKASLKKPELS